MVFLTWAVTEYGFNHKFIGKQTLKIDTAVNLRIIKIMLSSKQYLHCHDKIDYGLNIAHNTFIYIQLYW
jgi:inhibitor of KinA sporulation pathway (predicted exonuclease)